MKWNGQREHSRCDLYLISPLSAQVEPHRWGRDGQEEGQERREEEDQERWEEERQEEREEESWELPGGRRAGCLG